MYIIRYTWQNDGALRAKQYKKAQLTQRERATAVHVWLKAPCVRM